MAEVAVFRPKWIFSVSLSNFTCVLFDSSRSGSKMSEEKGSWVEHVRTEHLSLAEKIVTCDWSWFDSLERKGIKRKFLEEYQLFILCKLVANDIHCSSSSGKFTLSPSQEVENIWREHILRPTIYHSFCVTLLKSRFGTTEEGLQECIINYSPELSDDLPEEIQQRRTRTVEYLKFLCPTWKTEEEITHTETQMEHKEEPENENEHNNHINTDHDEDQPHQEEKEESNLIEQLEEPNPQEQEEQQNETEIVGTEEELAADVEEEAEVEIGTEEMEGETDHEAANEQQLEEYEEEEEEFHEQGEETELQQEQSAYIPLEVEDDIEEEEELQNTNFFSGLFEEEDPLEEDSFIMIIRTATSGIRFAVEVTASMTIKGLVNKIAEMEDFPMEKLKLVFQGRVLDVNKKIRDYSKLLLPDTIVHLFVVHK
jgi:hypothetical protein